MKTLYYQLHAKIGALCVALLLAGSLFATPAVASHFLYGNLSYTADGSGTVVFTLNAAFEREDSFGCRYSGSAPDGCVAVGDIISEDIGNTELNFGDGNDTGELRFEVISIDVDDRFFIAVALEPGTDNRGIPHNYNGSGPFTADASGCCRADPSELNNRSNEDYLIETQVSPQVDNDSPTTSLEPVVRVDEGDATATFTIPATDNEGDNLQFREATEPEATGESTDDGTPTFTIDQNSGQVTLDGTALTGSGRFYTEQVIIEQVDASGNVVTQTPIDFLIRPVDVAGSPPNVTITPSGPLTVEVNESISYDVEATDPDDDEVTLNTTSALPSGAGLSPSLAQTGSSPVSTTFDWTPTPGQEGSYVFNYSAEDEPGLQDQESITVEVVPEQEEDTTPPECGDLTFETNSDGVPAVAVNSATDNESGIDEIVFSTLLNLDGFYDSGDGRTNGYTEGQSVDFDPESVSSVEFGGNRTDFSTGRAGLIVEVTNGAGLTSACDPVIEQLSSEVPVAFELKGNYPNPFREQTTIAFRVAEPTPVHIAVYDALGREVATLVNEEMAPSTYEVTWDGSSQSGASLSSGVYFYRIEAGTFAATRKLVMVK